MDPRVRASSSLDGDRLRTDEQGERRQVRRTAIVRARPTAMEPDDVLMRDSSTGLVPRVALTARLQEVLSLGLGVGIIAVGLDWPSGPVPGAMADATLAGTTAKRITSGLRSSDLVASFGTDGFVVLVADAPAPEVLHAIARRLVRAASGTVSYMAEQLELRASAAYAMIGGASRQGEDVLAGALHAWRRARAVGGERVLAFDPDDDGSFGPVVWPAVELERALQAGEFEAHFQPVVDVASADLAGFEAFLRWDHPELGLLEPAQFLDSAETVGLLGRIGTEVMRQALRHLARWDARVPERPLTMGVNLSERQLTLPDLADTIGDLVAASGLPAERVRCDIAERVVMDDPERAATHLTSLRRQGVRVCLDDFGAGSVSMALLQRIPFDVLKLDRRLVEDVDDEPARTVLEAVVRFGHSLDATVLAEGVESPRELSALRRAGCDQAQGRLFSGPRPAHEIDAMLDRWLGASASAEPAAAAPAPSSVG